MRICYLLLSPTFGMHQYTADLANRMVENHHPEGVDVHLVTTKGYMADRYSPAVQVHTPIRSKNTGLAWSSLNPAGLRQVQRRIHQLRPDIVHFSGPHLGNILLLAALRRTGIPTIHTIHDLDPHAGTGFGALLPLWNQQVLRLADIILVHGQRYRDRLLAQDLCPERVVYTPLLHLFLSFTQTRKLVGQQGFPNGRGVGQGDQTKPVTVLFFGRLETYKGIDILLQAWLRWQEASPHPPTRLVFAGSGRIETIWSAELPAGVELRNHRIGDKEAINLFQESDLLVLPYMSATQSALVGAAYAFGKPVLVTNSGALAEYVIPGETGFIVPEGDPAALARTLQQAVNDVGKLKQMGENGRAWYTCQRQQEWETLDALYRRLAQT